MSTPTATPRTQALWMKHHAFSTEEEATEALCDFRDHGNALEAELACEKENRNHLIEKGAKLETELAAASQAYDCAMAIHGTVLEDLAAERAIVSRIWVQLGSPTYADLKGRSIYDLIDEIKTDRAEVEKWQGVAAQMSSEREHNANQAGRLRAELATCKDASLAALVHSFRAENDRLIDENVKLTARAEKAEAALAEWSVLNLWGGTPEIIHEFIKGQQNRIHHCQDLEAELAEAVDGEINGGSIPDTLLVIHVPRSPVGYRVGQPVKVILPAIDAAMKGTT